MRVSGLASGMDIDSIVKDMMKAQKMPLDKLKQQKQILEWQRDDYRSMNTLLLGFRSELLNMKMTSQYRVRMVSSSDESKLTATASNAASQGTHTISKVTQLAAAEVLLNKDSIKAKDKEIDINKSLYNQNSLFAVQSDSVWKDGAILSKNVTTKTATDMVDLGTDAKINYNELKSMSIKVDGTQFKVVTQAELDARDEGFQNLQNDEVLVDPDKGTLKFGKTLNENSSVKVNYIANERTDKLSLGKSNTKWTLNQGSIKEDSISFVLKKKVGDIEEKPSKTYIVTGDKIVAKGDSEELGTINLETGEVTFNSNIPSSDEKTVYSLEATYKHKYTTFDIDTTTSTGDKHESFLIGGNDSLSTVMSTVNNSSVGVNMFYDDHTGQMSLTRKETGDFNKNGNEIKTTGNFINKTLRFGQGTVSVSAQNAEFTINGLKTERSSNTFEVSGVSFTLKAKFDDSVTIGITNDSTKVYDNIKKFVDDYNTMISKIQDKVNEKRNNDYKPLTDDQKESLSDKQQDKWEEIAKTGLLRNDNLLNSALSGMRNDFYGTVVNSSIPDGYNQLSKIGITTTANYLEGGKLEINEAKLKKAIEENPDAIEQLFRGENGIAQKLTDTVNKSMDMLKAKAGNSASTNQTFVIGRDLDGIDKRVDTFEDRMKDLEDRYYRQFTAMEQAIQKANSQSNYLYSFFSNGN
ncbi:flagellar filament capping protein FliD [Bacillus testis]|uniref:flagellar filament capping protein FliD n=1 Tax=Bacillus testis TaxID=1622072 RepID=UPI000B02CF6F|nr:flagellar filament capping protein FliD [Bacillus testis]